MKRFLFAAVTLFVAVSVNAQVKSIGVAGHFMSDARITVKHDDYGRLYGNTYQPLIGGSVSYEGNMGGAGSMFEVTYMTGKLYDMKTGEYYISSWEEKGFHDLKYVSAFYYYGITFLSGKRFQIPVYFGLGLNFNTAEPIRNTAWALGAKARARFYITDNIALFGGAGWKGGLGVQTVEEKSRVTLDITQRLLYLEAGISVSLGM